MKNVITASILAALTVSFSTLDQSFRLGATTGALTGVAATYAGHEANGRSPNSEEVVIGAGSLDNYDLSLQTS